MISNLASVIMFSRDLDGAKAWYQDKLGFQVIYHAPGAFLSMKHERMGRLDFHPTSDEGAIGKGPMPNYSVDDIEKVIAWLESQEVKTSPIQQEGDSPKHAWFWDFEGNVLGLEEF